MFNRLYNQKSLAEKGTLAQLQVLIRRTNLPVIKGKVVVKNNTSAVEDFLDLMLDAHIVTAAADFFNLPSIDAKPTEFLAQLTKASVENRWGEFKAKIEQFVRKYVLHFVNPVVSTTGHPTSVPQTEPGNRDGVFDYAANVLGMGLLSQNFLASQQVGQSFLLKLLDAVVPKNSHGRLDGQVHLGWSRVRPEFPQRHRLCI